MKDSTSALGMNLSVLFEQLTTGPSVCTAPRALKPGRFLYLPAQRGWVPAGCPHCSCGEPEQGRGAVEECPRSRLKGAAQLQSVWKQKEIGVRQLALSGFSQALSLQIRAGAHTTLSLSTGGTKPEDGGQSRTRWFLP